MEPSSAGLLGHAADHGSTEGDPLPPLATADDGELVNALRSVLDADPGAATRPGQLRQKLEAALGTEESRRLRTIVHQLVAAAEENLPGYLTRIAPLTGQSLQQLSGDLASARGWNQTAAQRVTQIWAHALGFGSVADDWPQEQAGPPGPVPAPLPVAHGVTALPPNSAPKASTPWPLMRRRFAKQHALSSAGEPTLAATWGYAGMSLQVYIGIVAVLLILLVVLFVLLNVLVGGLLLVFIALGLRRAQTGGALLATEKGLEFVPYTALGRRPKTAGGFAAPWTDVTLEEGAFAVFRFGERHVQVGPINRAFTRAARPYVGGG